MEILMCASCWRVQHLSEEFGAELQEWSDPTTFMASGKVSASTYDIVDGYCDPCLIEMALRDQLALARAEGERLNA